jgi:archaeosine synthase
MLEILARDGLAREMVWSAGGLRLGTPNILFLHAKGLPRFSRGEAFLSADGPVEGRSTNFAKTPGALAPGGMDGGEIRETPPALAGGGFTLHAGGSWFLGAAGGREVPAVPPFPNIPPGLEAAPGEAYAAALGSFRSAGGPVLPVPGVYPPELSSTGAELFVFAGALENTFRPRRFAEELVRLKGSAGYGGLVYAPGLGEPAHLAFLAYCGVDLFDSAPLLAAARRGHKLLPGWRAGAAEAGVCHCPACESGAGGPEAVYHHNCFAALSELRLVQSALRRGRLRELLENRLSEPWLVAALRHLDLRHHDFCERYTPVARPASAGIRALGPASLTRPEIARFRQRVLDRFRRPPSAPVLLLLPCSARKPYSSSASHRAFRTRIDGCGNPGAVHEVVVTSPLGVVPMELQSFYPAGSYDVPVSGDWDESEIRMVREGLSRFISAGRYGAVVCHLPGMDFLAEALPPAAVSTGAGRAASREALDELGLALSGAVEGLPAVGAREAAAERLASAARFQFGPGGEALAEGSELRRFCNDWRVTDGRRTQLALLRHERGLLSLTMEGARRLLGRTGYEVEIGDFKPSGTVFMPGVLRSGADIRPGDEVLVTHEGELRGVGVALVSSAEMERPGKGGAVRMRHHLSSGEGAR